MKFSIKNLVIIIALAIFISSCSSDDNDNISLGDYENGIIISHEGSFSGGTGTVSYLSNDFENLENGIFSNVNGRNLGTVAQSISFDGDFAYIIINVSNQIEVVNRYTFESVATIETGLSNPRYMSVVGDKGYVTNWGDGFNSDDDYIAIIDLRTNTMTSETISVEEGPEVILSSGNNLYVAHQGGFSQNNIVSVIDASTNSISTTIEVGDVPNSLEFDSNGDLWVLSGGKPAFTGDETAGKISKIDIRNNSITASLDFATIEHPDYLTIDNGNVYYYLAGSVYKMGVNGTTLPTSEELSGQSFYEMRVRNSVLYGLDAKDFNSDGELQVFDLNTNTQMNSFTLDLIPGEIYFN